MTMRERKKGEWRTGRDKAKRRSGLEGEEEMVGYIVAGMKLMSDEA